MCRHISGFSVCKISSSTATPLMDLCRPSQPSTPSPIHKDGRDTFLRTHSHPYIKASPEPCLSWGAASTLDEAGVVRQRPTPAIKSAHTTIALENLMIGLTLVSLHRTWTTCWGDWMTHHDHHGLSDWFSYSLHSELCNASWTQGFCVNVITRHCAA